jgi:hypothetical protein
MEDLSNFTCILHCQRTYPVPDEMAIKVPENKRATSLYLNRYTISIEKISTCMGSQEGACT